MFKVTPVSQYQEFMIQLGYEISVALSLLCLPALLRLLVSLDDSWPIGKITWFHSHAWCKCGRFEGLVYLIPSFCFSHVIFMGTVKFLMAPQSSMRKSSRKPKQGFKASYHQDSTFSDYYFLYILSVWRTMKVSQIKEIK